MIGLREAEALELIEAEIRRRLITNPIGGIFVLPYRDPKPEPPPGFWREGEGPLPRVPSEAKLAETRLRALLKERRVVGG